jgi:hypothetical protein
VREPPALSGARHSGPVNGAPALGYLAPMSTDHLPLPDYDHLTLPTLTHRVRPLDAAGVQALLDHETAHGDRLPVVLILRERLEELQAGAQPTSGSVDAERPEVVGAASGGSQVTPATSGPPINPPSQGDPTNPAQPR